MAKPKKYDWENLDWTLSNNEISKNIGAPVSYVAFKRRELNKLDQLPPAWWQKCDWTKTNAQIASEFNLHKDTVAHRRIKLGIANREIRDARKDKGISRPQPHLNKIEYKKIGAESAKKSPNSGRFETNLKAKTWTVLDPNNQQYTFTNLMHFVRENPHLFDPADVVWRKKKNGVEWCRASSGIAVLARKSNPPSNWKGWKLISVIKSNDKDKK